MNKNSYPFLWILLLCWTSLFGQAQTKQLTGLTDSPVLSLRLKTHLLIDPSQVKPSQVDSLLQKQIPLAFQNSGENIDQLNKLRMRIPKENLPGILISLKRNPISGNPNSETILLTEKDLDQIILSPDSEIVIPQLKGKEFLLISTDLDSLPSVDDFIRFWDRTGKRPDFIQPRATDVAKAAEIVAALNRHPKIFGVVRNGDQLLADVSWKDYPFRLTNGYFSFPVSSMTSPPLSPYKAGYQFSPDIILPSPENLQNLKIFNAVPLDPDFRLTDHYLFSKKASNLKRKNKEEFILYNLDFVQDEEKGNCAYFSGKAYLDGGLMSRSVLKPNFSITAWIKPSELGHNNCILGKGKDFVLKIHDGLLTFTMQGIKDYYSKNTRIPLNEWTFISLVHTASDNHISFYLNGKRTETIRLLSEYAESDYTLLIGNNLWEEFFVGSISEIKIWDRELNDDEVKNQFSLEQAASRTGSLSWILGILFFIGALGIVFRRQFYSKKSEEPITLKSVQVPKNPAMPVFSDNQEQIRCFGGLKLIDKEGKDISPKFSPKLKQLFVLIFLHSTPGKNGIGSKELSDYLWPGMSPQNTKNIRGTNIQNLKALLGSCSKIKLVFRDKLWILEFDDNYFNDYAFIENSLNETPTSFGIEKLTNKLPEILSILKRGTLFSKMSESWVDPYIDRMSNRIIEFCLNLFRILSEEKHDTLLLDLAEVISINDPLNESALRKKIRILTLQGKLSLAHSVFENFTKIYVELYQEKYSGDFKALVANINEDQHDSES